MSSTQAETTRPIGPLDLEAERRSLGPALEEAVLRVLRSGRYVLGPEVEAFESDFAALHGVDHGVAVASGTDALWLAMRALDVEPGDEVVTSPFTFFASAGTIELIGARAVLADVDLDTALIDPAAVERAMTPRTKLVVPVHLYGQLCDMASLRRIADAHGVKILEDAAQAHAARRDGKAAGALGEAAAFSFYPTKNLGAAGEGGMVLTRSSALAERLRRLRDHGSSRKYHHAELGTNSRLHAMQAAVLGVKLPHLTGWNERRRAIAARYDEAFANVAGLAVLGRAPGTEHVFHQYSLRVIGDGARDVVLAKLAESGVHAAVHYPTPVHLQPAVRALGHGPGDFPAAERLAGEILCLPVHPFLAEADVDRVIAALRAAL